MAESEMVERVALRIWHERARHFGEAPKPFVKDERWDLCLSYAQSAFEVMREPAGYMVDELAATFDLSEQAVAIFWRQMVDAALHGPAVEIDMSDAVPSPAGEGR